MKIIEAQKSKAETRQPIGGVIVTHGHLASEFIAAAEMIVGPMPHVTPASIDWHDDIDVAHAELERAILRVSQGQGVLLLTDMFGGAPTGSTCEISRSSRELREKVTGWGIEKSL